MKKLLKTKVGFLQAVLTVFFVTTFCVSNIITSKQILLPFNLTMTGAIYVFPITYILSDVFSEVYGYKWSRLTCYLAFAMNLFMVLAFTLAIITPSPDYWQNQAAFETVLGSTPKILIASLMAYVIGDWANDIVFKKMKAKHQNEIKGFGWRAIISSLIGELVDSCIFLPIAFIGEMPMDVLVQMVIMQVLLKTGYEVIILPVTYLIANKLGKVEGIYKEA